MVEHVSDRGGATIVIHYVSGCSSLDIFNFAYIALSVRVPDCAGIFKSWADS